MIWVCLCIEVIVDVLCCLCIDWFVQYMLSLCRPRYCGVTYSYVHKGGQNGLSVSFFLPHSFVWFVQLQRFMA